MTVKIVKKEPDPSVVKQVVCSNCGIILEYLPIDVLNQQLYSYGEYDGSYDYIVCLGCEKRITLKEKL